MNPLVSKKRLASFATQMERKEPLTKEQFEYLAELFRDIARGRDANEALGLKYKRGQGESDLLARQEISLALLWIANARLPENEGGLGLNLDQAFSAAQTEFPKYSHEVLKKYWYQSDKSHMQATVRSNTDLDSPF